MAQQTPRRWFVPRPARPAAPRRAPPRGRARRAAPGAGGAGRIAAARRAAGDRAGRRAAALQVQLPPAPEMPPIAEGPATPAAIVGMLSVPDVLRVSTAYQAAYKELNARGQKLNEDAQKEQTALRELGQAFANERAKLAPEQIRAKEREIQDRATEAQRKFGERNRIIQEAGQYVMAQINRTMEQVAQQVALSPRHQPGAEPRPDPGHDGGFRSDAGGGRGAEQGAAAWSCRRTACRRWRWRHAGCDAAAARGAAAAAPAAAAARPAPTAPAASAHAVAPPSRQPEAVTGRRWAGRGGTRRRAIPASFARTGPHTLAAVVDAAEAEAPPRRLMLQASRRWRRRRPKMSASASTTARTCRRWRPPRPAP